LRQAGQYIAKLSKGEHEQKAWQTAMHCLIEVAEKRGPITHGDAAGDPQGR
jgi:hypothetical protein